MQKNTTENYSKSGMLDILGSANEIPKKIEGWNHTFQLARPYIKGTGVGIDVGCREGGFAREMESHFDHIHCFDFRDKKKMFKNNVIDMAKFTYHVCGIGDVEGTTFTTSNKVGRIKDNGDVAVSMKTLDSFKFENITFITTLLGVRIINTTYNITIFEDLILCLHDVDGDVFAQTCARKIAFPSRKRSHRVADANDVLQTCCYSLLRFLLILSPIIYIIIISARCVFFFFY